MFRVLVVFTIAIVVINGDITLNAIENATMFLLRDEWQPAGWTDSNPCMLKKWR
jgi:hypothetical protein